MNSTLFLFFPMVQFSGVPFLVNGLTLTIACVPIVTLLLILFYWRLQVRRYQHEYNQLLSTPSENLRQSHDEESFYGFDSSPEVSNPKTAVAQPYFEGAPVNSPRQKVGINGTASSRRDSDIERDAATVRKRARAREATPVIEMEPVRYTSPTADTSQREVNYPQPNEPTTPVNRPTLPNEATARLVYVSGGEHLPQHFALGANEIVRFGRQKSLCENVMDDIRVSRVHAAITHKDNNFYIQDEGSSGGTFVNQRKLRVAEQRLLRDGDTIQFDEVTYRFKRAILN